MKVLFPVEVPDSEFCVKYGSDNRVTECLYLKGDFSCSLFGSRPEIVSNSPLIMYKLRACMALKKAEE